MSMFGGDDSGAPEIHGYGGGLGQAERVGKVRFQVFDLQGNIVNPGTKYVAKLVFPPQEGSFRETVLSRFVQTDANGIIELEYFHPTQAAPFDVTVVMNPMFPAFPGMHDTRPDKLYWKESPTWGKKANDLAFRGKVTFEKPGTPGVIDLRHVSTAILPSGFNQGRQRGGVTSQAVPPPITEQPVKPTPPGTSGLYLRGYRY